MPYLGNGMTIAADAIPHVIISHGMAIGAIAFIVLCEYLGFRRRSQSWEDFARDFLKFTAIVITGVGAVTGVGVWLITSALSPRGIGSLLRIFFWPWFIEWMAFTAEVIVLIAYYFTWDRWRGERKKQHIRLGAAYIVSAIFSAFLITGILGFILTPDGWPWTRSFWSAFFNPSFLSQLLLRLSMSFSLGAVFSAAFLLFTRREPAFSQEVLRLLGKVFLVSFCAAAISSWWYFAVIPPAFKTHSVFSVLTSRFSQQPEIFYCVNAIGIFILLLAALSALKGWVTFSRVLIVPLLLVSMGLVAEFERVREFIRGPYLLAGYMYANQVLLKETPFLAGEGTLKNSYWYNAAAGAPDTAGQGAYLFAQNCSMCHTINGVNDIRERVKGRTEDGIFVIIGHTEDMVPFMPVFSGTIEERKTLARFLYQLAQGEINLGSPSRFTELKGGAR